MRKILFLVALSFSLTKVNAQLVMSPRGGVASPGVELRKYNYPSSGWTGGFALFGGLKNKYVQGITGFTFDFVSCGDETYHLKDGAERIYNTVSQLNLATRLVFNRYKLKPFVEYSYGALLTGFKDEFTPYNKVYNSSMSPVNNSQNPNSNPANHTSTWNQSYTTGFLYGFNDNVALELSVSYSTGGPTKFVDFSKVYNDDYFVYMPNIGSAPKYEMFSYRLGLVIMIDWTDIQASKSTSNSSSTKSTRSNSNSNNSGTKTGGSRLRSR